MGEALNGSAVKEVAQLAEHAAEGKLLELNNATLALHKGALVDARTLISEPAAKSVALGSLTGFLDFVEENVDKLEVGQLMAIVGGPREVRLVSALRDAGRDRETFVVAALPDSGFPFGQWQEQQAFVIGLMTRFVDTEERGTLVSAVSKLVAGESIELEDDGIGQKVTLQASAGVRAHVIPKPIQRLRPFRTFREIEQPESPFLLRVQAVKDAAPTLALFEADGGEWQNTARVAIKEYLDEQLSERKVKLAVLA